MPSTQIGAQLYTLRDFLKTPADIANTLARVKKLGYDAVQVSGFGPIDSKELANILKNEGLVCAATHCPLDRMEKETAKVIEDHHLWGCKYTAIGGFFQKEFVAKDFTDFAKRFNEVNKKFAGSGIEVGYHNHNHELAKLDNGQNGLQILMGLLDKSMWFEIDTYWIQAGGGDPVEWIGKVAGRIPCVHFKDMGVKTNRTQYMAEVGEGNLNWPAIIKACKSAGVKWYLIEQDDCYRDPFDSLEISLKNLKGMGLS
jgi:sugar phosphate isomerase/epimerase